MAAIDGNYLTSSMPLRVSDAVAAILVVDRDRYLMQLRDDVPDIWYPGHWGLFGGAVDAGEDEIAALRRELREELELELQTAELFVRFDFDLTPMGLDALLPAPTTRFRSAARCASGWCCTRVPRCARSPAMTP